MTTPEMLAAVDLGSNSFRMVIARVVGEELQAVDRLREGVRLAAYLGEDKQLTAEGRQRAVECLRKFGQRLRHLPAGSVRAVGTNTLRKARNSADFLHDAEHALGHSIDIISGREEARLIFIGAAHTLAGGGADRRLVVDIGGGSTECIIGDGLEPLSVASLYMGCVSYTLEFFGDGILSAKQMRRAETAARLELRSMKKEFRQYGWQQAVGASGTVQAIDTIVRTTDPASRGITPESLARLRTQVLEHSTIEELERSAVKDLKIPGLKRERARVLPGGIAILNALFETLEIDHMTVSPGALREGVLYDLLGRQRHEDTRDRTIQRFTDQYHVDAEQAERVRSTALACLDQVIEPWKLDRDFARVFLSWATTLHEIGLTVAHSGYHKHGAYLVQHSDMPGFSLQNQRMLALLVRGHRRKLPTALFRELLSKKHAKIAIRLCLLLRLACLLNRSRAPRALPPIQFDVDGKRMRLGLPTDWLQEQPLTRADLKQEIRYLDQAGFDLQVR